MNSKNEIKQIREEILKNKEYFLLQFINDIPDEVDLEITDEQLFKIEVPEHKGDF